jgi:hypothetical protein
MFVSLIKWAAVHGSFLAINPPASIAVLGIRSNLMFGGLGAGGGVIRLRGALELVEVKIERRICHRCEK